MGIVDLEQFSRFSVQADVYERTIEFLQAAGAQAVECVVVWAGVPGLDSFLVDTVICPRQFASAIGSRVTAEDIDEMYGRIYSTGRTAVAQIHSHPGEAYHSDTDEAFAIVTRLGAVSLVVPHFGLGEAANTAHWIGFRIRSTGWERITPNQLITLIEE